MINTIKDLFIDAKLNDINGKKDWVLNELDNSIINLNDRKSIPFEVWIKKPYWPWD